MDSLIQTSAAEGAALRKILIQTYKVIVRAASDFNARCEALNSIGNVDIRCAREVLDRYLQEFSELPVSTPGHYYREEPGSWGIPLENTLEEETDYDRAIREHSPAIAGHYDEREPTIEECQKELQKIIKESVEKVTGKKVVIIGEVASPANIIAGFTLTPSAIFEAAVFSDWASR